MYHNIINTIHLKAPENWINDPNGFIYYKGLYHLFYQHFPYEPRWGRMHWGHAVSKDLVHWQHQSIALFPSKHDDRSGCYSGSAVEHNGRLYLFYTGMNYLVENPEDINLCFQHQSQSSQMMITSEDGFHIDNIRDKRTVIPPIENPEIGDKQGTRDPKVWRGKDAWYMVLGSCTQESRGKLLFFKSEDLEHWEFANGVTKEGEWGGLWECPDYFKAPGGEVLIISPINIKPDEVRYRNQTICTQVHFDEAACHMEIGDTYQYFDYGFDLYAPQSTADADGRRIVVAWARMPQAVDGVWNGMFCIPREVEVKDGHIYFHPHPLVKAAFHQKIDRPDQAGDGGYRFETDLEDGEEITVGGYRIYRTSRRICTDRSHVYGDLYQSRLVCETPELDGGFHIDVYVDSNLIEVYVNDGQYVISNVVYGLGREFSVSSNKTICLYGAE